MKIELEAKEGYEWVECGLSAYIDAIKTVSECASLTIGLCSKYYIRQPIKPKYDYSDFTDEELVSEHDLLCFEMGFTEEGEVLGEKIKCCKDEILRRMNRED